LPQRPLAHDGRGLAALAVIAPVPDLPAAASGAQRHVIDTAHDQLALAGQDAAAIASTLVSYIKFDPANNRER
jgi:hypothetical protein